MLIAARFALYLDLMLVFGLPLFCLYTFRGAEQRSGCEIVSSAWAVALSAAGAALTLIGLLLMAANMSDAPVLQVDRETVDALLNQTATGTASKVRILSLMAILPLIGLIRTSTRLRWSVLSALGAISLGSLVWTGHGAADEGVRGTIHLAADITHLLAAGIWLGALTGLLILLLRLALRTTSNSPGSRYRMTRSLVSVTLGQSLSCSSRSLGLSTAGHW